MTRMCQKLIVSVLIATLIHGIDAECMNQSEFEASEKSYQAQLSQVCKAAFGGPNGSPPNCSASFTSCGYSMSMVYFMNCTGPCSYIPEKDRAAMSAKNTQPLKGQTCLPSACNNAADRSVYLSYLANLQGKHNLCTGIMNGISEEQKASMSTVGIALEAIVTVDGSPKLSCEKNSKGEIVIDGEVIPATSPPHDSGEANSPKEGSNATQEESGSSNTDSKDAREADSSATKEESGSSNTDSKDVGETDSNATKEESGSSNTDSKDAGEADSNATKEESSSSNTDSKDAGEADPNATKEESGSSKTDSKDSAKAISSTTGASSPQESDSAYSQLATSAAWLAASFAASFCSQSNA